MHRAAEKQAADTGKAFRPIRREQHRTRFARRARIADYKSPRSVDFVAELPKNASGKLARKLVREQYWMGATRRVN